jgi:GDPmannose 4,6-dehydratase
MRVLITGVTGQDGSYLAQRLLAEGHEVFGVVRRVSQAREPWCEALLQRITVIDGDLLDGGSLLRAVEESRPDEVYHLGAQTFVGRSWREPVHTAEITGLGAVRMLEAVRALAPKARFYQASTSEMFGDAPRPWTASGPFQPRSPYGFAKVLAHHAARNYRDSYGMFVSCGILFNHESPRRGVEFVTRKVARAAVAHRRGQTEPLRLGNLDARRDWGWAPDYVDAMVAMVRAESPMDLVIASGKSWSVRELCERAYAAVGLDWRDHVVADLALARPADVEDLVGDPTEAAVKIGWRPKVGFDELVERLVVAEQAR